MSPRRRVVYITSMGHSGSTLLDLLLSAHSRVASVGEVKTLVRRREPGCSCAARTVWECPFWLRAAGEFERETGAALRDARILDDSDPSYAAHNRALFDTVARLTGKSVIVDSSKCLERLGRLLRAGVFDLLPVHLVRCAGGVTYSFMRKGYHWPSVAFRHGRRIVHAEGLLRGRPHLTFTYEELAARPDEVVRRVLGALDLSFEPGQLRWAQRERHNCEGNRMRRTTDSEIRPDVAWRSALPAWQRSAIRTLSAAGRLSAYWWGRRRSARSSDRLELSPSSPGAGA